MDIVSAKELLKWIYIHKSQGGDDESLYLLLDISGGLTKKQLYNLKVNSLVNFPLKESLKELSNKWFEHLKDKKPIQYICGATYWRDLKLNVSQDVLIPRVETEQIIDIVNTIFPNREQNLNFVDLGTGSGAIAIALALANPNWQGYATDIDNNALEVARNNLSNFKKVSNLSFLKGNWWMPLKNLKRGFDLAIANPPYIPKKVYEKLPFEVKGFEPKRALYGGDDGFKDINIIISNAPKYLADKGWLIIESHFDQGEKVKKLFLENGFDSISLINDCFGIGRFTIGRYK